MKTFRYLLAQRYAWIESQLFEDAERNGYGYVTPAMSRMFGQMGKEPLSISELARRLILSRQAVHQMANEAARHGLVELVDSPINKRVKLVTFTAKGQEMYATATDTLQRIEQTLVRRLGKDDAATLRRILEADWDSPADLRPAQSIAHQSRAQARARSTSSVTASDPAPAAVKRTARR